jgi:hypothetical protein
MFQIQVDKSKNLLHFTFSQHVTAEETGSWREQLCKILGEMKPGFTLLSDLSALDLMDLECATDIEWSMEALDEAGIARVVRVIPDPRKDIGFNIMSHFHYRRAVAFVTCDTMEEALKVLAD